MRLAIPFGCFLCIATAGVVQAFVIPSSQQRLDGGHSGSSLLLSATKARVTGGGVPMVESGDCKLFDPALEGKLAGTDDNNVHERIAAGANYGYLSAEAPESLQGLPAGAIVQEAQHWLEDIGIPSPYAKATKPVMAEVLGRVKLIEDDAPGDIEHIVLRLPEGMHYVEGQSISVIPPGTDDKGKTLKPRLYSIASTRYGDLMDGSTVSLCVRRAEYIDPDTGVADPTKKGVCSNFLCDTNVGDVVSVAGPVGKSLLLPDDETKDIIMVATGTGIAPFRGFLHRLFLENTVARHMYTGKAWLILGVPTTGSLLYDSELKAMQHNVDHDKSRLEVSYAISREMKTIDGSKYYVQHVLMERADEVIARLQNGAVMYFCGLKGMMPDITKAFETAAAQRGRDWQSMLSKYKANGQWHVEVY